MEGFTIEMDDFVIPGFRLPVAGYEEGR